MKTREFLKGLKKEEDSASIQRLEILSRELADLQNKMDTLTLQWSKEKESLQSLSDLKKQLEETRLAIEQAKRNYNLEEAAKLEYGVLRDLENQLRQAQMTAEQHQNQLLREEVSSDDIAEIARTYHAWRGEAKDGEYEDKPGYCKAATLDDIKANDYVLTPGRYVGAAEIEDDGIPFEEKMAELTQKLYKQMEEAEKLDAVIRENLAGMGYVR